jgi:hypothetical protein
MCINYPVVIRVCHWEKIRHELKVVDFANIREIKIGAIRLLEPRET